MSKSWHQIDSSFINAIAYDRSLKTLYVRLKGNNVYVFKDVPKDVYKTFLASTSKGQFFNSDLKDNYSWAKED